MERPSTPLRFKQIFLWLRPPVANFKIISAQPFFWGCAFFLPALRLGTSSLLTPSLNRRGTAELFELSRRARFVQCFEADPSRSVPKVWQKRLGSSAAPDRWAQHGRGLWCLIWLDDGDPHLAFSSASNSSSLDLLFADALHRSSFDQLDRFSEGSLRPWSRAACRG